jgi:hypothetical protein
MNTHLSKIRPTEWMLLTTFATYLVVARAWAKSDVDVNSSRVPSLLLVLAGICLLVDPRLLGDCKAQVLVLDSPISDCRTFTALHRLVPRYRE